ncbi:hypothetical protein ACFL6P_06645 [Candidatus Latescibacterota bacterium]
MKKLIRYLGLGIAFIAGIQTTVPSIAPAQEHIQTGHVQIVINNEQGPPCQMSAILFIDSIRRPYMIQSDKTIDTVELDYNTPYKLEAQVYAEDPDYENIFPFRRDRRKTYTKEIEINHPKSRMEIIVEYDEGTKLANDFKAAPKGKVYWGELTNFFDNDLDTYIDDIENFFGTDITKDQDNPDTLPNLVIIYKNGKLFYISNKNYLPHFPESECYEDDEKVINDKIQNTHNEINKIEENIVVENVKRPDENGFVTTRMGNKNYTYNKETAIKSHVEYKNKYLQRLEELKEEKKRIYAKFLTDYDMFMFEQYGNSLKILFKKSDDETWQDITEQPNFYKERRND